MDGGRLPEVVQTSSSKPAFAFGIPRIPHSPNLPCLFCRGKHWNWECTVHPSASERLAVLRKCGLCVKCNNPHSASKCKRPEPKCWTCKGPHLRSLCEVQFPDSSHSVPDEIIPGNSAPKKVRNTSWRKANEDKRGEQRKEAGGLEKHIADLVHNAVLERTQLLEAKIRSLESVILEQNKAKAQLAESEQRVEEGERVNDLRSQTLDAHQSQLCELKTSLDEQAKSVDERERITTDWEIRLQQREKALDEYQDALDRQRREFQATSTRQQGNVHEAGEEVARVLSQLQMSQTTLSALQRLLVPDTVIEVPNEVLQQLKQEPNDTVQENAVQRRTDTAREAETGPQNAPSVGTSLRKRSSQKASGAVVANSEVPAKCARHGPASARLREPPATSP